LKKMKPLMTGNATRTIRETLYARVWSRKIRLHVLARDLGIPLPTLEVFVKGEAGVSPLILEILCRALWGDEVRYCGSDDELRLKNLEKFIPDVEPIVRHGEAARRRAENREKHKERSREGQLKKMRRLEARQRHNDV